MTNAAWAKLRRIWPYSILVFRPRREFTIGEITAMAAHAGLTVTVRVVKNG